MKHSIVACAFILAAGLLLNGDLKAGSLEPPGPPAPTMKALSQVEPRVPISSLPLTISQPGSYYLTQNVTGVSGQVGITITVSHVTVDLSGFSLTGVPGSLDGIRTSGAIRGIEIRNGTIRNWGAQGVSALTASDVHAEDLRVDGNVSTGLTVGPSSIVRDTTASANAFGIVALDGSMVIGCTAETNAGFGIQLGQGSRVVDSVARANGTGIVGGDGSAIEGCTAVNNTDDGIRIGNRGLVRGNLVRSSTNDGIEVLGFENRIEDNQSTQNNTGIRITGGNNLVVRNSAGANVIEFSIAAGNKAGAISADPTTAGLWTNFDL